MIVEYNSFIARKVRGTNVAKGQTLYAVRKGRLYWIWAYTERESAEIMDARLGDGPKDEMDRAANWRGNVDRLTPTGTRV